MEDDIMLFVAMAVGIIIAFAAWPTITRLISNVGGNATA